MKNHPPLLRAAAALLAALLPVGCSEPEPEAQTAPFEILDSIEGVTVDGQPASIWIRRTQIEGSTIWPVQVAVAEVLISFSVPSRPTVSVAGDTVSINQHRLQFRKGARELEVAGAVYALTPGSVHMFGDGGYLGRVR